MHVGRWVAAVVVVTWAIAVSTPTAAGADDGDTFGAPEAFNAPTFPDQFVARSGDQTSAEAGPRSITVTPDTNLVDGQAVTVAGTGFGDPELVGIFQCAKGLGLDGCDLDSATPAFDLDNGAFSETHYVAALLDTEAGPIDCRTYVDGCRVVASEDFALAGSARADVTLDPLGPLAPPPSVAVDPASDLVDEQVVQVTATGFRAHDYVLMAQCTAGTTIATETCGGSIDFVEADGSGTLEAEFQVDAVFYPFFGDEPIDCRVEACEIAVAASYDYERFGAAAVTFDPDAPLHPVMNITVTPHADLVDDQVVQVEATGYTPNGPIDVVQCIISSNLEGDGCELDRIQHLTSDADGSVATTYAVNDEMDTADGRVSCLRTTSCILVAVDRSVPIDFGRGYTFTNLYFAGDDDPPPFGPADPIAVAPAFTG